MDYVFDILRTTDVFSFPIISILIGVGFIVGFINTVSGGATAISYALFMAMGMPLTVANATTRLGVTMQFLTSTIVFGKKGIINKTDALRVGVPVAVGSIGGAMVACEVNQRVFEIILAVFLILMMFMLIFDSKRFLSRNVSVSNREESFPLWKTLVFCVIGFYGGFTHIGVGLLILFGSVLLLKTDLLHANGIKQMAVVMYSPLALIVFGINGIINWPVAVIYGVGNVLGGYLGSVKAINWGVNFIRWFSIVFIGVFIIYLVFKS